MPPKCNNYVWEYPKKPWERVHADYAGPIFGKFLLIVVDAFSKWTKIFITSSTTSEKTSELLFDSYAEFGIPDILVTDNGPQFTSAEFRSFLTDQGVRFHRRIAPYHPSTNGQAERYVQSVKQALRAMNATPKTLRLCLNKFLMHYHRAPHQTTKVPPSSLFINRIRSNFSGSSPRQQPPLQIIRTPVPTKQSSLPTNSQTSQNSSQQQGTQACKSAQSQHTSEYQTSRSSPQVQSQPSNDRSPPKQQSPISLQQSNKALVTPTSQARPLNVKSPETFFTPDETAVVTTLDESPPKSTNRTPLSSVSRPPSLGRGRAIIRKSIRPSKPPDRYTPP
nr:PREDICTED: uncharacterized protein K02A2.6-like [Bemisia tabaci]